MELTVTREVQAPASTVWSVITDLDGSAEVLAGVDRIERLDDTRFEVGTRWRETRTMFGKQATEVMEVTAIEPGARYTVTSVNGSTTYTSVLQVEPTGADRSRVSMSFGATNTGIGMRIMAATLGRLMQGATRKMLARDLDDIAAAAERASG